MAPRSGTGYIGLDQWLSLNRPAATGMADRMVGGINAKGQNSETALNNAMSGFRWDMDQNTLNFKDDGLTEAEANRRSGMKYGGLDKIEGYKGFDEGLKLAGDAQGEAGLASDFYGRQALLQDEYGKGGGYSLGQQRLDSALAGAAGGDKIDAAKSQWGSLLGKYKTASTDAKTYAADAKTRSIDAAKKYNEAGAAIKKKREDDQRAWDLAQRPDLQKETPAERAERDRQREEDRAARKENSTGGRGGGGGKANVDRWTSSFLT